MYVVTIEEKTEVADAKYSNKTKYSQSFEELNINELVIFLNEMEERCVAAKDPKNGDST